MTAKPGALVLAGDGINCEAETAWALELAGFRAEVVHMSAFFSEPKKLLSSRLLSIPGGFSFGDEIASGKVLAVEIKTRLSDVLNSYVEGGGLVLGVCNGFQVLVQLGILPFSEPGAPRAVTLTKNSGGRFIDRWVRLVVPAGSNCPFLSSPGEIQLPIRHGEGRLVIGGDPALPETLKKQTALRYLEDVNGSYERIAGLVNGAGNVLGLMPHPEAFVRWSQHPSYPTWRRQLLQRRRQAHCHPGYPDAEPDGLTILKNARAALA